MKMAPWLALHAFSLAVLVASPVVAPERAAPRLVPQGTLSFVERARDPERDPLPADARLAEQILQGYRLFLDTPGLAPAAGAAALSCGSCHLSAGQREGALPLIGIAAVFPEYNRRVARSFTLEDRIVG
jgi:thiosulfate dehydrogenase